MLPCLSLFLAAAWLPAPPVDVARYPSLQAAIDANPGRMIHVPEGEYRIAAPLRIEHDGTGLYGPARIVQTDARAPLVVIRGVHGARLEELSFSRDGGDADAEANGIDAADDRDLEIRRVEISGNHSHSSILVQDSRDVTIEDCTILNYKGRALDDRTANKELYGYAFQAIDGTGIQVLGCQGAAIRDNIVNEDRFVPSVALREKYGLGRITVVPEHGGRLASAEMLKARYTANWHQGAAIQVSRPETSKRIILTGNRIENAAQGMDIHSDYVVIENNIIDRALIGMKAMHGCRHVLISGNHFSHIDRWGVMVMPGAASHGYSESGKAGAQLASVFIDGPRETGENVDAGTIISNNIFSDFGFGNEYWNWPHPEKGTDWPNVIAVLGGQLAENPPIHNILITGNVVYDNAKDGILIDGKWEHPAPRYHWALYVEHKRGPLPQHVRAYDNLFDPGLDGPSNLIP